MGLLASRVRSCIALCSVYRGLFIKTRDFFDDVYKSLVDH
jgi:hypothetical protein